MKILCPRAYYDPEQTAGSHLMNDLEDHFTKKHKIVYIVSTPTRGISKEVREQYKYRLREEKKDGKILIQRFPMLNEHKSPVLRAIRYILCNIAQIHYGSHVKNVDIIYSGSTPPTMGLACIQISKRITKKQKTRVPIIYKLDDIFPDSLVQAGLACEGGIVWKVGRIIENYIYNNVDVLIVNCDGMKNNLLKKNVPESKIRVVSNWIDFSSVKPIPKEKNRLFNELKISREDYIVLYAGNFGEAQGAEIILDVAKKTLYENKIKYVVFGGGSHFNHFKEQAKEMSNIQVYNLMPLNRVSDVYSLADVTLITCKPGFGGIGMPSKTWSIMACNKPIIASYDINSDLSTVIERTCAGIVVEPGNSDELAEAILRTFYDFYKEIYSDYNIRDKAIQIASKEICTKEYLQIIEASLRKCRMEV